MKKAKSTTTKISHIAMTNETKQRFDSIKRKIEFKEDIELEQEDLLTRMMDHFEKEVKHGLQKS